MNQIVFRHIVKENSPKPHNFLHCVLAFLGGGIIGIVAQGLIDIFIMLDFDKNMAYTLSSLIIVIIVGILTLFNIYPKLGQIFGAGLFVPISGFANASISSSLEGRSEGFIAGIGSRIFSLTGSVISYGVVFSVFVVIIRYILTFFGVELWKMY